jgi:hypothetical protein
MLLHAKICRNRHLQTFTAHFVNLWGMMRKTVEIMTYYMKYQETQIGFKDKYNKKELLYNKIPQEEETSTLVVDSEEEDEQEAWIEVEVRSFVTTAHNQDTWKGTVRTLVPLVSTATHSNLSLNIVLRC